MRQTIVYLPCILQGCQAMLPEHYIVTNPFLSHRSVLEMSKQRFGPQSFPADIHVHLCLVIAQYQYCSYSLALSFRSWSVSVHTYLNKSLWQLDSVAAVRNNPSWNADAGVMVTDGRRAH